jgi:hypothetical protein
MTAFTLDGSAAGAAKALQDSSCINDYIGIPGKPGHLFKTKLKINRISTVVSGKIKVVF